MRPKAPDPTAPTARRAQRVRRALGAALVLILAASFGRAQDHVVQPGDTLYALAARYDTDVATLRRLNGIDGSLLRVGAVLALPAPPASEQPSFRPRWARTGETLTTLAVDTGRSLATLTHANPELGPGIGPDDDLGGRLLLVPPADGWTVRAAAGDTLARLAERYRDDPAALAARSGLVPSEALMPGQPLLLLAPPAAASAAAPAIPVAVGSAPLGDASAVGGGATQIVAAAADAVAPPAAADVVSAAPGGTGEPAPSRASQRHQRQLELLAFAPVLLAGLDWSPQEFALPLQGSITSRYGWRAISVAGNRFHNGLDLGAPSGTPVRAARDGVVVTAGWVGSYGYAVYLDHGDGSQTRYAHLSRIDARRGSFVRVGDRIGAVGSTGASTGPHLHFEIRLDGRSVDPLLYLSER